jgi:hypothetical protein
MNSKKDHIFVASPYTDPDDDFVLDYFMSPENRWYTAPPNEHHKLLDELRK